MANSDFLSVIRALDPRIHPSSENIFQEDGWSGQDRP
jgi:hypothetical protein